MEVYVIDPKGLGMIVCVKKGRLEAINLGHSG